MGNREHNHVGDEHEENNDVICRVMEGPVVTRSDGRPFDPNDLRRQIFYKVLSLAGMRRDRFHDLRHSFASLLIGQGEKLVYIKNHKHPADSGYPWPPDTQLQQDRRGQTGRYGVR